VSNTGAFPDEERLSMQRGLVINFDGGPVLIPLDRGLDLDHVT